MVPQESFEVPANIYKSLMLGLPRFAPCWPQSNKVCLRVLSIWQALPELGCVFYFASYVRPMTANQEWVVAAL